MGGICPNVIPRLDRGICRGTVPGQIPRSGRGMTVWENTAHALALS